jgi:hypothetical protein
MCYSIEFGQEGYTVLYGFKSSNTIPFHWLVNDYNKKLGPAHCNTCQEDGTFEGIFYGLCGKCAAISGHCPCVYCRVAKKDGHKRIEKLNTICKLIKTLQTVVAELKLDYPEDEYGIVKEGIESGLYILNLHTNQLYEDLNLEAVLPTEVTCRSNGELTYRWNPSWKVPDSVCFAALEASKRLGTYEWVKALWAGTKYESLFSTDDQVEADAPAVVWHSELCDRKEVYTDFRGIAYCCPFDLWHKEKVHNQEKARELAEKKFKICDECGDIMPRNGGKCTGFECANEDDEDYDVQCSECSTWIPKYEINKKGYCLDCQNPEYDPVWPKGD